MLRRAPGEAATPPARTRRALVVAGAGSIVVAAAGSGIVAGLTRATANSPSTAAAPAGRSGVSFELNEGQTSGAVRFIARGAGYPLYLTAGDAVLVLANPSSEPAGAAGSKAGTPQARPARPVQPSRARSPKTSAGQSPSTSQAGSASAPLPDVETGAVVRLHMVGANPSPQITGEDRLPGITNYLIGRSSSSWIRGIASYAQVRYHDVYPGVDLVYHANSAGTGVEYDYVLAAGADASQIAVDVQGADSVKADGTGGLAVASAGGQLVEQRPAIYQDVDGARHAVSGGYRLTGPNRFGFSVGAHDPSKPVVVDPQLSYLTYLGGNLGQDQFSPATGVAVDAAGSAYTAGYTFAPDFPTTTGAFQTSKFGDPTSRSFLNTINAFVSKLAPDGRSLVYSTYLGGTGQGFFTGDRALAIALDSANDAYVTGDTSSPDFPTTPTAFQAGKPAGACATCTSAFVSELNPSGSALLYSTYVGGSNQSRSTGDVEGGKSIAVDASGKIFVGGAAASLDFPTTPTAFQRGCVSDCATNADGASTSGTPTFTSAAAFFTPFDAGQTITGANIPDNTFIQSVDSTTSITLGDGNGTAVNATATGTGLTFTIGGRGFAAAFAAKLDPAMSGAAQLRYATLLGGSGTDANVAYALGLDGAGDVYLAGKTRAFDFPTTNGALATRCEGCSTHTDGVTTSGMTTFTSAAGHFGPFDVGNTIFGTDIPSGTSIAAVTNATTITLSQPATATGSGLRYDAAIGNVTGFVARLDPSASGAASLVFSTFLGGSSPGRTFNNGDVANGIAVDPATHRAYVTGTTTSPDFPTTSGALERACDAGRPGACGANPTFADGTSTNGSATYRSATAQFTAFDEGANIAGPGIPDGTYVQTFVDSTTVTLSNAATATGSGAFILGRGARTDAFVTELAASGGSAVASTFLGGPDDDASLAIALDGAGHVHVAGNTSASTYPSVDPVAAFGESAPSLPGVGSGGPEDATVTELDGGLSSIVFSTTLGGGNADTADTIAVDASGAEYVAGNTKSTDLPTTPGAFRSTFESNQKAWAAKIAPLSPTRPLVLGASPEHGPIGGGTTVTVRGRGFTGASAVAFGGVPAASFQVDSDTQVTAVSPQLPAGTAFADVTVTAAGGTTPANPIDRFTVGDGEWNPTGPIDADRNGPTATLLANGKVLVVGGTAASRIGNPPAFPAELYDALTGTWSAAAAPNLVWANGSAVRLADGRVLLVGGTFGGIGAPQAEIYDPVANTWTVAATPTSNHGYGSAALLQTGQVLAIGGFGGPSAELYDPAANTWSPVGSVSASFLIGQTETLLPDGEVLVAGGCCTTGPGLRTDAELYDPLRRTFTATGSMGAGRWAHTATLLPNGDVLVAGGAPQQGDSFAWTAEEVYHPATGTWALEGVMDQGSQGGGAALLPNGRVLLAGGTVNGADLFSPALSTAELFDPANPLGQVRADRMTHGHGEYNGRLGGHTTALVLLSSNPNTFQADPAVCGSNCGKVLVVGGSFDNTTELYTPSPAVDSVSPASGSGAGGTSVTITGTGFTTGGTPRVTFGGVPAASVRVDSYAQITAVAPAGTGTVDVVVRTTAGPSATSPADAFTFTTAPPPPPPTAGYWLVASDGGIFPFGTAGGYGSTGGVRLNKPVVGMAATPDGRGYWLVASDGGIFPFGDAQGFGSTGAVRLNKPIVGMAATPDGRGYWLVAADGGIFPFGDAKGFGSTGAVRLNQPIVGMASTPDGGGYWLVASDGGIFPFGDATGRGSTGAIRLNKPVVGMAATPDGGGYWLVASDGGIFPFGDAVGYGSTGAVRLNRPMVGMAATRDGGGYWLVASDGGIFPFGDAQGAGSTGGMTLNAPIVGMAAKG